MVNEKERIIKKMGTDCTIKYPDGSEKTSKFFIGRATDQFSNILAIESQRKGDFIYGDNVTGGCLVSNNISNEEYIVVAINKETFRDMVLATAATLFVCNSTISAYTVTQEADEYGNITNGESSIIENLKVYAQAVDHTLVQYAPGLHQDTEFVIYAPYFDVDILDYINLNDGCRDYNLKVVAWYVSNYSGVVIIEAKTETRKLEST